MKRKIHRPHWKQIAKRAKRKLKEIRSDNGAKKQPIESFSNAAAPETKLTKAQQKWFQRGFHEAREADAAQIRRLEDRISMEQARAAARHQRREDLKPALELINRLLED